MNSWCLGQVGRGGPRESQLTTTAEWGQHLWGTSSRALKGWTMPSRHFLSGSRADTPASGPSTLAAGRGGGTWTPRLLTGGLRQPRPLLQPRCPGAPVAASLGGGRLRAPRRLYRGRPPAVQPTQAARGASRGGTQRSPSGQVRQPLQLATGEEPPGPRPSPRGRQSASMRDARNAATGERAAAGCPTGGHLWVRTECNGGRVRRPRRNGTARIHDPSWPCRAAALGSPDLPSSSLYYCPRSQLDFVDQTKHDLHFSLHCLLHVHRVRTCKVSTCAPMPTRLHAQASLSSEALYDV